MKILYLCPDLGIPVLGHKGASVHVRELSAALARAGHQVTLVAQMLNKSPWEKPAQISVPLIHVRPGSATSSAVAAFKAFNEGLSGENLLTGELRRILYNQDLVDDVRRRFENEPPDFIYERASLYATAGATLAQIFKVPLVLELNAPLAAEQSAYRSTGFGELAAQAERWTLAHADVVLTVSSELKNHVLTAGIPASRVHVTPNGVNLQLFRPARPDPALREKLNVNGGPILGFVGGLRPWHGVEILPELVARLLPKHKKLHLIVAGDGQLRSSLLQSFRKLKLQDRVTFTGAIAHDQVPSVVRHFDVALAPYPRLDHDFYFSPLKLYEYMACGVPVAASNIGQIAEVISHGKTGLLHKPGDLDGLVANCNLLLTDDRLRKRIGRDAAALVAREFTWDHNARRVVALALGVLERKSAAA